MCIARIGIALILSAAISETAGLAQSFALHDGDRVVFYGDSITAQRLYTRFVEDIVLTRYPQMHITFWNAGVPGDTVKGGYTGDAATRLRRDVFPHSPTVVTVLLGINDAGWGTFHQDWFEGYISGYRELLGEMEKQLPGVRITVIEPTPYDEVTHGTEFPNYNSVVERYAKGVAAIGGDPRRVLADFYSPVMSLATRSHDHDPSLATLLLPDRIHPSEVTHWVMAAALVRAWGISPVVANVHLDSASAKTLEAKNADVTELQSSPTLLRWTQLDHALPLPLNLDDPMTQFMLKVSDLAKIDQQVLRISGLKLNRYLLKIDLREIASFTREELAAGVNLAVYPTPMEQQARELDAIEAKRTRLDEARFLLADEGLGVANDRSAAGTLEAADEELERAQRTKAFPVPHTFELIAQQ